jgi:hypothetical protein
VGSQQGSFGAVVVAVLVMDKTFKKTEAEASEPTPGSKRSGGEPTRRGRWPATLGLTPSPASGRALPRR